MDKQREQELLMQASYLEKNSQEIAQQIEYFEKEIMELDNIYNNLSSLEKGKGNESYSALGKGLYIKSQLAEEKILVHVGTNVLIKKGIDETRKIVEEQIKKLSQARAYLMERLELYNKGLRDIMDEFGALEHNHPHGHDHAHIHSH
ncbi:prefoldin subunit alpha [Candidatus Pacearchaeota archaeon]|nr:prefoldin subunit alpha [Candidatus Pacearchaeota archaeon]